MISLDDLRSPDAEDGPRVDHARQQRDRHHPADRRSRPDRPRAGHPRPHGCRPELRQDRRRRAQARRRLPDVSAHKIYGPKGIGALYIRRGAPICPFVHGGGRSGASGPGPRTRPASSGSERRFASSRRRAERAGPDRGPGRRAQGGDRREDPRARFNGHPTQRIKSTVNFAFPGLEAEAILLSLATKEIYVSTGSACSEESEEVSTSSGPSASLPRSPARPSACPWAVPIRRRISPSSCGSFRRSSAGSGRSRPSIRRGERSASPAAASGLLKVSLADFPEKLPARLAPEVRVGPIERPDPVFVNRISRWA